MEATTPTPTPTTPIAEATPTTPTPAPTPTPTPMPMVNSNPTMPTMAEGGATSEGGLKGFFKSLNWMEVTFSVLGVAALTYVIYYYRFKLKQDKMINNELQRQIDEIKMNLQVNMKGKYKSM
jgi:hypothetical protein